MRKIAWDPFTKRVLAVIGGMLAGLLVGIIVLIGIWWFIFKSGLI